MRCEKDYAVRILTSVFVKSIKKWWDGYKNEKYVLISDVEPSHCAWLTFFFLNMDVQISIYCRN